MTENIILLEHAGTFLSCLSWLLWCSMKGQCWRSLFILNPKNEIFIMLSKMFYIAIKCKNTVNIFQSHPMGPIGEFARPIQDPKPYAWHHCPTTCIWKYRDWLEVKHAQLSVNNQHMQLIFIFIRSSYSHSLYLTFALKLPSCFNSFVLTLLIMWWLSTEIHLKELHLISHHS